MKKQILILILILNWHFIHAQFSEGGTPASFSMDVMPKEIPARVMPEIDVQSLLEEDAKRGDAPGPFRFGYIHEVDIDIKKAGIHKQLPNGNNLWLLKIHAPNAYSINLIYNRFHLAEGSRLFIYNEDRTMILGAFTPETSNNPFNEFATDLV